MSEFINPFNTGSPAEPERFFGRFGILNQIKDFLRKPEQNTFIIHGQRRIGKTSLLKKIVEVVPTYGFTPIYFDLQDKGAKMLNEVLFELMQKINIEIDQPDKYTLADFKKDEKIFETRFLNDVFQIKPKVLFLFDEFDILGDKKTLVEMNPNKKNSAYIRFVPYLNSLIAEKLYPFNFMFVVGRSIDDLSDEYYGPIMKFAEFAEMGYFTFEESKELITKLTEKTIQYPDDTIREIHRITYGYPLFLQCVSSFLFDKANELNKSSIDKNDVEKYLIETIKRYKGGLTWYWNAFKPEGKAFLFLISQLMEENVPATEKAIINKFHSYEVKTTSPKFIGVLSNLLNFKAIEKKDDNYFIPVPFIQKWIATEHNIESFKNELQKVDKIVQKVLDLGLEYMESDPPEYPEAITQFRTVLNREPDNFTAQYNLAFALLNSSTDTEAIILEFENSYNLNKDYSKNIYIQVLKKYLESGNQPEKIKKIIDIEGYTPQNIEILQKFIEKNKDNEWAKDLFYKNFVQACSTEFFLNDFSNFDATLKNEEWILSQRKPNLFDWLDKLIEKHEKNIQQEENLKIGLIGITKRLYELEPTEKYLKKIIDIEGFTANSLDILNKYIVKNKNNEWAKEILFKHFIQTKSVEILNNDFTNFDVEIKNTEWILKQRKEKVLEWLDSLISKHEEKSKSDENLKNVLFGISKRQYDIEPNEKYLKKIIEFTKDNKEYKLKLFEFLIKKYGEIQNLTDISKFKNLLDNELWIINELLRELELYFSEKFKTLINAKNFETAIHLFNALPEKINRENYYSFVLESINNSHSKEIDELNSKNTLRLKNFNRYLLIALAVFIITTFIQLIPFKSGPTVEEQISRRLMLTSDSIKMVEKIKYDSLLITNIRAYDKAKTDSISNGWLKFDKNGKVIFRKLPK